MTTCETIRPLIDERGLGLLDDDQRAALTAHTEDCADCSAADAALDAFYAQWAAETRTEIQASPLGAKVRGSVLSAAAPANPPVVSVSERPRVGAATCVYCHDREAPAQVECRDCHAPHHSDCFAIHGTCAAPGCAGIAYHPLGAARGPRRRRPRRWSAVLAGACVLGVLGGGLAALTANDSREFRYYETVPEPVPATKSVAEALERGSYRRARDLLRAEVTKADHHEERSALRVLAAVAEHWRGLGEPESFDWSRAAKLLRRAQAHEQEPRVQAWLEEQVELIEAWEPIVQDHSDAEEAFRLAYSRDQRSKPAAQRAEAFRRVAARFEDVVRRMEAAPPTYFGRVLLNQACQQRDRANTRVVSVTTRAIRERMRGENPNWAELARQLEEAEAWPGSAHSRMRVRELLETCEMQLESERHYVQAVEIVKAREVERYAEARRLLRRVDAQSRVRPDAQAYLEWIDADVTVRMAKAAYDRGDLTRALELLDHSVAGEVLGEEAHASVKQKRAQWKLVAETWASAEALSHQGKKAEARQAYLRILELEPNEGNAYNLLARKMLGMTGD